MNQIRDTEGRTAQEFLAETFEYEVCSECGGDAEDHDALPLALGAYGGPYFFAQCRGEVTDELREARLQKLGEVAP